MAREVNWKAVAAPDFRDPDIKEGKPAEFLVREFFRGNSYGASE